MPPFTVRRYVLNRFKPIGYLAFGFIALYGSATLIGFGLSKLFGDWIADLILIVGLSALCINATCLYIEALVAWLGRKGSHSFPTILDSPAFTAIIAAQLENEQDIILSTLDHFIHIDYAGPYEVILAYNRDRPLEIEDSLHSYATEHPRCRIVHIEGSHSKAENVNSALELAQGEVVGIFDADHYPQQGAFDRAVAWIASGYDMVQGHCAIRMKGESFLERMIAVEFELMYSIFHFARYQTWGFGIFGGSNGYWRREMLSKLRLSPTKMTEDIDVSARAILAGCKTQYDDLIVSTELSPPDWTALWSQRQRWAQGWFQVTLSTTPSLLRKDKLPLRSYLGMIYLFPRREFLGSLAPWLMIGVILQMFVGTQSASAASGPTFFLLGLYLTLSLPFVVAVVKRCSRRNDLTWQTFASFALFWMVLYIHFLSIITFSGHCNELLGRRRWRVTPRRAL